MAYFTGDVIGLSRRTTIHRYLKQNLAGASALY
jgi:hypothetical protein